jgi:hypothetical protein
MEYHYQPFDPDALITVISETRTQFPNCTVGRSGNGTGNLCVYDRDNYYVGVIELHDPPELYVFSDGA